MLIISLGDQVALFHRRELSEQDSFIHFSNSIDEGYCIVTTMAMVPPLCVVHQHLSIVSCLECSLVSHTSTCPPLVGFDQEI